MLDSVKSYLKIEGTSKDTLLNGFISQAKKVIEASIRGLVFTGTQSTIRHYTDIMDSRLYVFAYGLTGGSLTVTGRDNPTEAWMAVTVYLEDGNLPMIYSEDWDYAQYKIDVMAGWADNDVPNDLKMVITQMVAESYEHHDNSSINLKQQARAESGVTSTTVFEEVINKPQIKLILDRYRFPLC
jgi:hypothetical protein